MLEANQPIGSAKGIFPGRVVWVHNPNAVNQNCVVDQAGHGWFLRENNNQAVIDAMVSSTLKNLTGQTTDSAAWGEIFKFHNTTRGKGAVNYVKGEKIFIKINATSSYYGNFNVDDLTPKSFTSETSVGPVLATLRQLVNVVGVDQKDIYVGDPLKHIYKHLYDVWHGEFPNVHYLDNGGYTNLGRETVTPSNTALITYSDKGAILKTNVWSDGYPGDVPSVRDNLYSIFETAEYMINIPMLKGHKRAGVTMFAKNHFGSHTRGDASHLHNGLVAPTEMPNVSRGSYGLYRVQVDIMGHSLLGKKNLLYLMDALWSTDAELNMPLKWHMPPFSNGYTSSLFASFDPVAIESVGYDFVRSEFTAERIPAAGTYAQMPAVDDYLRQASSSANWPTGIKYDPDNTGGQIASLGTHEHWNNAIAKQYSKNISTGGSGIELMQIEEAQSTPPASRLAALSTRAFCGTGNNVTIGGFVVNGPSKRLLIRAVGPTLTEQGLSQAEVLRDPVIKVYDKLNGSLLVASNDNWGSNANAAEITSVAASVYAYPLANSDTSSSALLTYFPQGVYSVVASGAGNTTGNVLVEVYDADAPGSSSTLKAISTRAFCGTGNNVGIAGFVVSGTAKRVLLRAVGPTLTEQGLGQAEVLTDPIISVYDKLHNSALVASNDNWGSNANAAEIRSTSATVYAYPLAGSDSSSAALLITLQPGVYSFIASGKAAASGNVLIEVYDAD